MEVWIIDGGSNDGTQSYLESLKAPFNWVSEEDRGIYDAMNKGIFLSKGQWLLFLGCDDKFFSNETLNNIFSKPVVHNTKLIMGKVKYDWRKEDSNFIKNNDGVVTPSWSKKIWIKNTLPHQGLFYNRNVFDNINYSLDYNILSDYALNLKLYIEKVEIKNVDTIISICGTSGISKSYIKKLYIEEIKLKTDESSILFKPFFIIISSIKYLIKRLNF